MADVDMLTFLGIVFVISLSGVLMPGPMTAATILRSYSDKWAGAKVSIGHAFIEFPLLAVITLGVSAITGDNPIVILIGLIGGVYLLVFGATLIRRKQSLDKELDKEKLTHNAVVLGITTTLLNPGFFLWWFAVGSLLVTQALTFGIAMIAVFGIVHWSTDFMWGIGISFGVQRAKKAYAEKIEKGLRIFCAILIIVFGAYFLATSILNLL